jgi:flotillin
VSKFAVKISLDPQVTKNAVEYLLGLKMSEIQDLASDIIIGQIRLLIADMDSEAIVNPYRNEFLLKICENAEAELNKVGLCVQSVNIVEVSPIGRKCVHCGNAI